jgi:regulator of protease activity HflC (stomatin/prohibitin superfamily)
MKKNDKKDWRKFLDDLNNKGYSDNPSFNWGSSSKKEVKGPIAWIINAGIAFFVLSTIADLDIINFSSLINNFNSMSGIVVLLIIALFIVLISIRQVNQYERGVKFQFGKFKTIADPGWRLVWPIIQNMTKVDIRIKAVDVPFQETITKDNVSAKVNAVLYYKVTDSQRAIIDVEDFMFAVSQLAQTTMRNVVGEMTLDELLSNREQAADKIRQIVDVASDPWGLKVDSVELKDVILPDDMARVIGKQAEAEREKRSVIIKAEGEVTASENLRKAAETLSKSPGALHLRTLSTLNDLSSDQSNTVVFAIPLEILRAFEKITKDPS